MGSSKCGNCRNDDERIPNWGVLGSYWQLEPSCGGRGERRIDGGEREYADRQRPTPNAAKQTFPAPKRSSASQRLQSVAAVKRTFGQC